MEALIATLIVFGLLYMLPSIVACVRHEPQVVPITIVNLFLEWTLIGWVVALAWASRRHAVPIPDERRERYHAAVRAFQAHRPEAAE